MNERERSQPVTPAVDEYLRAHREMQAIQTARQRNWNGLDVAERLTAEVTWQATDDHLAALRERGGDSSMIGADTIEALQLTAEERIARWRLDHDRDRREVKMLERLGEPVPDDLRKRAEELDQGAAVDDAAAAMRLRAKRTFTRVLSGTTS